jgi:hypothetical protein
MGAVGLLYGVRMERRNGPQTPFRELKRMGVDGPHPLPPSAKYGLPVGPTAGGQVTLPDPGKVRYVYPAFSCGW